MMKRRLNDRKLMGLRKEPVYEAVMTDLYLAGVLDKDTVQRLTGRELCEALTDITKPRPPKTDVPIRTVTRAGAKAE